MEIYTNAPASLDMECTHPAGSLGWMRIVRVEDRYLALKQLQLYRKKGYFGGDSKANAVAYMSTKETADPQADDRTHSQTPREREGPRAVDIYTTAPDHNDLAGTKEIGQLGLLRIVRVPGDGEHAREQVNRYEQAGYFATSHKADAIAYVTQKETLQDPSGSDM